MKNGNETWRTALFKLKSGKKTARKWRDASRKERKQYAGLRCFINKKKIPFSMGKVNDRVRQGQGGMNVFGPQNRYSQTENGILPRSDGWGGA